MARDGARRGLVKGGGKQGGGIRPRDADWVRPTAGVEALNSLWIRETKTLTTRRMTARASPPGESEKVGSATRPPGCQGVMRAWEVSARRLALPTQAQTPSCRKARRVVARHWTHGTGAAAVPGTVSRYRTTQAATPALSCPPPRTLPAGSTRAEKQSACAHFKLKSAPVALCEL
jgi:hypothetical protein